MRKRLVALAVPITVGALTAGVSGCGDAQTSEEDGKNVAVIGAVVPLSGSLSAFGAGIANSVDLAIKQANAAGKLPGWTIKFAPEDDQATAEVGQRVASTLASRKAVVGVVGTYNSSVALQVGPVLQPAHIAMISPANTNPALTQGPDYATGKKVRPWDNYFRVCTTDSVQGPFGADYLLSHHITKVATVNDQKAYGVGIVDEFTKQFTGKGGKVTDHEVVTAGQQDYSSVISKIKPGNPQAVYYGGEYPEASLLSKQMKAAGLNVPLMGGDGIYDPTYIQVAGAAANGDLATSVGAPTDQLPSAKQFIADYQAAGYKEAYSAYGAYAYDAANVIINTLSAALAGKDEVDDTARQAVVAAVQNTKMTGATGAVAFDEFGDTTNRVLTAYKVEAGAWKPVQTATFNAGG